jgi:hypothetical protein
MSRAPRRTIDHNDELHRVLAAKAERMRRRVEALNDFHSVSAEKVAGAHRAAREHAANEEEIRGASASEVGEAAADAFRATGGYRDNSVEIEDAPGR